jgi:protein TonB
MQPKEIMQADLIDILFENRNKQYGAYKLRRQYPTHLLRALIVSVGGVFGVIILFSFRNDQVSKEMKYTRADTVTIKSIDPTPKEPVKPQTPTSAPRQNTIQNTNYVIVPPTIPIDHPVPTVDQINVAVISTVTHTSDSTGGDPGVRNNSDGPGTTNEPITSEYDDKYVFDQGSVDEYASFPGGLEALARFMQRHLRDPRDGNMDDDAKDIKVQVKFVVDREGVTGGFEIVTSGGQEFDEAVIRALKKMPKWKPASWRNKKVAMYYLMPVTFAVNRD